MNSDCSSEQFGMDVYSSMREEIGSMCGAPLKVVKSCFYGGTSYSLAQTL